jgi:hypothetical protein
MRPGFLTAFLGSRLCHGCDPPIDSSSLGWCHFLIRHTVPYYGTAGKSQNVSRAAELGKPPADPDPREAELARLAANGRFTAMEGNQGPWMEVE